ncbi:MAG: choice-of-anchor I family protein [Acidobacteriota bacterium]
MVVRLMIVVAILSWSAGAAAASPFVHLGTYDSGANGGAEIAAYHAGTKQLYVNNTRAGSVDVIAITDPSAPRKVASIAIGAGGPTSVAVHGDWVAVAVQAETSDAPGEVRFFAPDGTALGTATIGIAPDMLTFTPDGSKVVVANEGERGDMVDPIGGVSIVDVSKGPAAATVTTLDFSAFDEGAARHGELEPSVRIYTPGASVAQDVEPEYVAISPDGERAWVTLQENNALAVLDLETPRIVDVIGLGFKDHGVEGHGLDASDRDGRINIQPWPVRGMYQPDAIVAFVHDGEPYVVTANEGDSRQADDDEPGFKEEARVRDLDLETPLLDELKDKKKLGRLKVTRTLGDTDGDGKYEALYSFGARSISVWRGDGSLVWDSGEQLARAVERANPDCFNCNGAPDERDTRSDDKGIEPEGLALGLVGERRFVFVGLERVGGVAAFDIGDPTAPELAHYESQRRGDRSPEGLLFLPAATSPNGKAMLVLACELSGTVSLWDVSGLARSRG